MLLAQTVGPFAALVDSITNALLSVIDAIFRMSTTQVALFIGALVVIWLIFGYRR